jgi:nucleotide-binding universal stress UspA family protein
VTTFGKILVAIDFDDASLRALDYAMVMAKAFSASLTLVHVYDTTVVVASAVDIPIVVAPAGTDDAIARGEEARRGLAEIARTRGLEHATLLARPGKAADEVLACAAELGSDLIVVGAHRRNAISRLLLGSVAQAITQRAQVPVLSVRAP